MCLPAVFPTRFFFVLFCFVFPFTIYSQKNVHWKKEKNISAFGVCMCVCVCWRCRWDGDAAAALHWSVSPIFVHPMAQECMPRCRLLRLYSVFFFFFFFSSRFIYLFIFSFYFKSLIVNSRSLDVVAGSHLVTARYNYLEPSWGSPNNRNYSNHYTSTSSTTTTTSEREAKH
jgi:hypothetical protein